MIRRLIVCISLIFAVNFIEARLPNLEGSDVCEKISEIMNAHVKYKKLDSTLIERVLRNFIEELDPMKTYFIKPEIQKWLSPSGEIFGEIIEDYAHENFSHFEAIHDKMIEAIARRNIFEGRVDKECLPVPIPFKEFAGDCWADDVDALFDRIGMLKSVLLQSSEVFSDERRAKFFSRIVKQRLNYEEMVIGDDMCERKKFMFSNILKAFASSLDAHTMYFTPDEATQFMIDVQRRLFGIGVQLRDNLNGFTIVKIIEGGPACLTNKLKPQDRIVAIDDEPVTGMSIGEVVELMRGDKGTSIELTIVREVLTEDDVKVDETFEIDLVRDEVVISESRIESDCEAYGDGVIAIVKLHSFYQDQNHSSEEDLATEIEKIKAEHKLNGVVLDMRYNSGGLLSQAIAVTGLFITQGVVASVKDNTGDVHHFRDFGRRMIWDGPMVVLTSRMSASASEIVAQTLQDYGCAIVVGDDHTFGKGTFQTFTLDTTHSGDVNSKGEYKVTRGMYYTVSGKSPQCEGVCADIVIPGVFSQKDIGERYESLALEGDSISENFVDTMSDLSSLQRLRVKQFYGLDLQLKIDTYTAHLEILRGNSATRINKNSTYQKFLLMLKDSSDVDDEIFKDNDLQLTESVNVVKDLIFLTHVA